MDYVAVITLLALGGLVMGGVALAVQRSRAAARRSEQSTELVVAADETRDLSASIVTEVLPDTGLAELMNEAIPIDPLSELATQVRDTVGPVVQAVLATTPLASQRGRFLVEFSVEGAKAFESGGVKLLQRVNGKLQPTLIGGGARIKENATLVGRGGQVAMKAAAVAHVAILLAVQAQLVAMQRTLERMEAKIDALRRFLDDKEIAGVRARIRHLAELRDQITDRDGRDDWQVWLVTLDAADVDFLKVQELAKRQCSDAAESLERAGLRVRLFGPSGDVLLGAFWNERDRYELYADLWAIAVAGRVAVAQLKAASGRSPRIQRLEGDVEGLAVEASRHHAFLERRAHDFGTLFRSRGHEHNRRQEVFDAAATFRKRSDRILGAIHTELRNLQIEKRSVRTIVEMDEGGTLRPVALLPAPAVVAESVGVAE